MFNLNDTYRAASLLNIKFEKFTSKEFLDGMNIELEHGTINPITNVTDNDLTKTAKIALRILINYYSPNYGIKAFEEMLKSKLN